MPPKTLTQAQLEHILRKAGWSERLVPIMSAIGMAESSGNVGAYNPGVGHGGRPAKEQSIGPWQINMLPSLNRPYDRQRLATDPVYNAQVAKEIYSAQGLKAWGAYTDGRYRKYYKGTPLPDEEFDGDTQGDIGPPPQLPPLKIEQVLPQDKLDSVYQNVAQSTDSYAQKLGMRPALSPLIESVPQVSAGDESHNGVKAVPPLNSIKPLPKVGKNVPTAPISQPDTSQPVATTDEIAQKRIETLGGKVVPTNPANVIQPPQGQLPSGSYTKRDTSRPGSYWNFETTGKAGDLEYLGMAGDKHFAKSKDGDTYEFDEIAKTFRPTNPLTNRLKFEGGSELTKKKGDIYVDADNDEYKVTVTPGKDGGYEYTRTPVSPYTKTVQLEDGTTLTRDAAIKGGYRYRSSDGTPYTYTSKGIRLANPANWVNGKTSPDTVKLPESKLQQFEDFRRSHNLKDSGELRKDWLRRDQLVATGKRDDMYSQEELDALGHLKNGAKARQSAPERSAAMPVARPALKPNELVNLGQLPGVLPNQDLRSDNLLTTNGTSIRRVTDDPTFGVSPQEGFERYVDGNNQTYLVNTQTGELQDESLAEIALRLPVKKVPLTMRNTVSVDDAKRRLAYQVADQIGATYNLDKNDVFDWVVRKGIVDVGTDQPASESNLYETESETRQANDRYNTASVGVAGQMPQTTGIDSTYSLTGRQLQDLLREVPAQTDSKERAALAAMAKGAIPAEPTRGDLEAFGVNLARLRQHPGYYAAAKQSEQAQANIQRISADLQQGGQFDDFTAPIEARAQLGIISRENANAEIEAYRKTVQEKLDATAVYAGGATQSAIPGMTGRSVAMAGMEADSPAVLQERRNYWVKKQIADDLKKYGSFTRYQQSLEQAKADEAARQQRMANEPLLDAINNRLKAWAFVPSKAAISGIGSAIQSFPIWTKGIADYLDTLGPGGKTMATILAPVVMGLRGLGAEKASSITQNPMYRAGQWMKDTAHSQLPTNKDYDRSFWWGALPQGVGSSFAFMPAAIGGPVGIVLFSTMQMTGDAYDEGIQTGASESDARNYARINGALLGWTELLGFGNMFQRMLKSPAAATWKKLALEALKESGEEVFLNEGPQAIGGDLLARLTIDPNRKWDASVIESMEAASVSAPLVSVLVTGLLHLRHSRQIKHVAKMDLLNGGPAVRDFGEERGFYVFGKPVEETDDLKPLIERHRALQKDLNDGLETIADINAKYPRKTIKSQGMIRNVTDELLKTYAEQISVADQIREQSGIPVPDLLTQKDASDAARDAAVAEDPAIPADKVAKIITAELANRKIDVTGTPLTQDQIAKSAKDQFALTPSDKKRIAADRRALDKFQASIANGDVVQTPEGEGRVLQSRGKNWLIEYNPTVNSKGETTYQSVKQFRKDKIRPLETPEAQIESEQSANDLGVEENLPDNLQLKAPKEIKPPKKDKADATNVKMDFEAPVETKVAQTDTSIKDNDQIKAQERELLKAELNNEKLIPDTIAAIKKEIQSLRDENGEIADIKTFRQLNDLLSNLESLVTVDPFGRPLKEIKRVPKSARTIVNKQREYRRGENDKDLSNTIDKILEVAGRITEAPKTKENIEIPSQPASLETKPLVQDQLPEVPVASKTEVKKPVTATKKPPPLKPTLKPATAEEIHAVAKEKGVDVNSPVFHKLSKDLVGVAKLDHMSPMQLTKVREGIKAGRFDHAKIAKPVEKIKYKENDRVITQNGTFGIVEKLDDDGKHIWIFDPESDKTSKHLISTISSENDPKFHKAMLDMFLAKNENNKNFREFFKGSKAVDFRGNPVIYFHGGFQFEGPAFNARKTSDFGFHFGNRDQANARAKKISSSETGIAFRDTELIPAVIQARRPLRLRDEGHWSNKIVFDQAVHAGALDQSQFKEIFGENAKDDVTFITGDYSYKESEERLKRALEKAGYDSIVYTNEYETDVFNDSFILFRPEQIKSIYNNGNYSSDARFHKAAADKILQLGAEGTSAQWVNRNENTIKDWNKYLKSTTKGKVLSPGGVYEGGLGELATEVDKVFKEKSSAEKIKEVSTVDLTDYLQKMADANAEVNNPDIAAAVAGFRRDPKESTDRINKIIADNRTESLQEWKDYLTKENPVYARDPFFRDWVWTDLIRLRSERPDLPLSLDKAALSAVYADIKEKPNSSAFQKLYEKKVSELMLQDAETSEILKVKDGTWIKIPQTDKTDPKFKEAVAKVQAVSRKEWCTSQGMAETYIQWGDFWVLIKNQKSELAVRFDDGAVAEIQGKENNGNIPEEFLPDVKDLVRSNKVELTIGSMEQILRALKQSKFNAKRRVFEENVDKIKAKLAEKFGESEVKFAELVIAPGAYGAIRDAKYTTADSTIGIAKEALKKVPAPKGYINKVIDELYHGILVESYLRKNEDIPSRFKLAKSINDKKAPINKLKDLKEWTPESTKFLSNEEKQFIENTAKAAEALYNEYFNTYLKHFDPEYVASKVKKDRTKELEVDSKDQREKEHQKFLEDNIGKYGQSKYTFAKTISDNLSGIPITASAWENLSQANIDKYAKNYRVHLIDPNTIQTSENTTIDVSFFGAYDKENTAKIRENLKDPEYRKDINEILNLIRDEKLKELKYRFTSRKNSLEKELEPEEFSFDKEYEKLVDTYGKDVVEKAINLVHYDSDLPESEYDAQDLTQKQIDKLNDFKSSPEHWDKVLDDYLFEHREFIKEHRKEITKAAHEYFTLHRKDTINNFNDVKNELQEEFSDDAESSRALEYPLTLSKEYQQALEEIYDRYSDKRESLKKAVDSFIDFFSSKKVAAEQFGLFNTHDELDSHALDYIEETLQAYATQDYTTLRQEERQYLYNGIQDLAFELEEWFINNWEKYAKELKAGLDDELNNDIPELSKKLFPNSELYRFLELELPDDTKDWATAKERMLVSPGEYYLTSVDWTQEYEDKYQDALDKELIKRIKEFDPDKYAKDLKAELDNELGTEERITPEELNDELNDDRFQRASVNYQELVRLKSEDLDDKFIAKITSKVDKDGNLEISPAAAELIRRVEMLHTGEDSNPFLGGMLRSNQLKLYIPPLRGILAKAPKEYTKKDLKPLRDLVNNLATAYAKKSAVIYIDKSKVPHEMVHKLRYQFSGFKERVSEYYKTFNKVFSTLEEIEKRAFDNYFRYSYFNGKRFSQLTPADQEFLHEELIAHILDGDYGKLGITDKQAARVISVDTKAYLEKNGDDVIDELQRWIDENQKQSVLEHKSRKNVSKTDKSTKSGRGKSSTRSVKTDETGPGPNPPDDGNPPGVEAEDERDVTPRAYPINAQANTQLNPEDLHFDSQFYTPQSREGNHEIARQWLEERGIANAVNELYDLPVNAITTAKRQAVLSYLDAQVHHFMLQGNTERARAVYDQMVGIANTISPEYTEWGQAISQLAYWQSLDPEAIVNVVENKRARRGKKRGTLDLQTQEKLRADATEIETLNREIDELEDIIRGNSRHIWQGLLRETEKLRYNAIDILRNAFGVTKDTANKILKAIDTLHGTKTIFSSPTYSEKLVGSNDGIAFGWGIYSTQSEKVARWYRNPDNVNRAPVKYQGHDLESLRDLAFAPADENGTPDDNWLQYSAAYTIASSMQFGSTLKESVKFWIKEERDGIKYKNERINDLNDHIHYLETDALLNGNVLSQRTRERISDTESQIQLIGTQIDQSLKLIEAYKALKEKDFKRDPLPGAVYKNTIDGEIYHFLRWDLPYNKQSEFIKTRLNEWLSETDTQLKTLSVEAKSASSPNKIEYFGELIQRAITIKKAITEFINAKEGTAGSLGGHFYNSMPSTATAVSHVDRARDKSKLLLSRGILGNSYLIAADRGKESGELNFVNFSAEHIQIVDMFRAAADKRLDISALEPAVRQAALQIGKEKYLAGKVAGGQTLNDWKSSLRNELSQNSIEPTAFEPYMDSLYVAVREEVKTAARAKELERVKKKFGFTDNEKALEKLSQLKAEQAAKLSLEAKNLREAKGIGPRKTLFETALDNEFSNLEGNELEEAKNDIRLVKDRNAFYTYWNKKGLSAKEITARYIDAIDHFININEELKSGQKIRKMEKELNAKISDLTPEEVDAYEKALHDKQKVRNRKMSDFRATIKHLTNRPETPKKRLSDWYLRVNRAGETMLTATLATVVHNIIAQRGVKLLHTFETAGELAILKLENYLGKDLFTKDPTDINIATKFSDMFLEELYSTSFPATRYAWKQYRNKKAGLLAALSLVVAHKQKVIEGVLAYNPDLYEDMYAKYSYGEDVLHKFPIDDSYGPIEAKIERGVRGVESWTHFWTTLNRLQENHFKSATFLGILTVELKARGIDPDEVIVHGKIEGLDRAILEKAVNRAAEDTFSQDIPKTNEAYRAINSLSNFAKWIPFPLNPVLFRRFLFNSTSYMVEHSPLVLAKAAGPGVTARDFSKCLVGVGIFSFAVAMLSNFGSDDDDPLTLSFFGTTYKMTAYNPLSTFLILASILTRASKGKKPLKSVDELWKIFGVDTRYPNLAMEWFESLADLVSSEEDKKYVKFNELNKQVAGRGLTAYFKAFATLKAIQESFDTQEATIRDYGREPFTGELKKNFPLSEAVTKLITGSNTKVREDALTGEPMEKILPWLNQMGVSIVPEKQIGPKFTAAEEYLDVELRKMREKNVKFYKDPKQRTASGITAQLFTALDKGVNSDLIIKRAGIYLRNNEISQNQYDNIVSSSKNPSKLGRKAEDAPIPMLIRAMKYATPSEFKSLKTVLETKALNQAKRNSLSPEELELLRIFFGK